MIDVNRDDAQYRPVSMRFETQNDFDQLLLVLHQVAYGTGYSVITEKAAQGILKLLDFDNVR